MCVEEMQVVCLWELGGSCSVECVGGSNVWWWYMGSGTREDDYLDLMETGFCGGLRIGFLLLFWFPDRCMHAVVRRIEVQPLVRCACITGWAV